MKTRNFALIGLVAIIAIFGFIACGDDDDGGTGSGSTSDTGNGTTVSVTNVTLNKTSLPLNVNAEEVLAATVLPANATNKNVVWRSGNTGIASVDTNGKVTAKALGTATITATTVDGGKTAQCTVTVSNDNIVTYDANGATSGQAPDAQTASTGSSITLASGDGLAKTDHTFGGWNTASDGTGTNYNAGTSYTPTGSITLYAKWNVNGPVSVTIEMVQISGGTFTMGSPTSEPYRYSDETQHQVTLTGFYMGKYQVTQEQYEAVMGYDPATPVGEVQANRPVEHVSWYEAVEFCNELSEMEGLTPYYTINKTTTDPNNTTTNSWDPKWLVTVNSSANGYRLPTEAQWEYACRAGTTTAWSFGNSETNLGNYAWYRGNSDNKTHEVGKKLPNTWGLYDMYGNVCEWCWDWYGSYSSGAQTDPTGAVSGDIRVMRGGFLGSIVELEGLRSAARCNNPPHDWYNYHGIRLVRP